jgi:hypothetical protein
VTEEIPKITELSIFFIPETAMLLRIHDRNTKRIPKGTFVHRSDIVP